MDAPVGVVLELTIGADGVVSEAKIVQGATSIDASLAPLDAAAQAAALRFRFEPAKRNGEPVPSIIRYRYVFELREPPPAPPSEAPPPPPLGRLEGRVKQAGGPGLPIEGAEVLLQPVGAHASRPKDAADESKELRLITDAEGFFHFEALAPARYRITIFAAEYEELQAEEDVRADEIIEATYRLKPTESVGTAGFGATAVVEAPPREAVRRTIPREQLTTIPGTRGDALRTIEILPGVARPPFGGGQLLIRGSSSRDSQVFFDGDPVPQLYHFGGLTSFANSRMLDRIDFYPGNFSARYGRKMGGIVEVAARDPATDKLHGVAEFGVIDMSLLAEGPIDDKLSIAVAARRSLVDLVFEYFVPRDLFTVLAAPVYWDYQAYATYKPTSRDRIRLKLYGSDDAFKILLPDSAGNDPQVSGNAEMKSGFYFNHLSWLHRYSPQVEHEISFMIGPAVAQFNFGELGFEGTFLRVVGRGELRARLSPRVRVIAGIDYLGLNVDVQFKGPVGGQGEGSGRGDPLSTRTIVEAETDRFFSQPAAFVEADLLPFDPLQLILGLRLDYFEDIHAFAFDPRLVAIVSATKTTKIKGGVGIFSQPPQPQESLSIYGTPDLKPPQALHLGLGVEQLLLDGISISVDGFYKRLRNRIVEVPGTTSRLFSNDGIGRIYGLEVLGKIEPKGRPYYGFLSYTLSRSERKDRDEDWRLFDYDQPHIFTLVAAYRFPMGWEAGLTFRLVSGNPTTPVVGSIYDAATDTYYPINGKINSERNPLFHRLDLRVEKIWKFKTWKLAAFIDIQNVYNQQNQEGLIYSYDWSESTPITGLPFLPALGVRGEL